MTKFVENGIEDLETILELNDVYLDALEIPMGYKLKILKRIKTLRQEMGLSMPESRQGRPESSMSSASKSNTPLPMKQMSRPDSAMSVESNSRPFVQ